MTLHLGDKIPNFTAQTQNGTMNFYEDTKDRWSIMFSHPSIFTPVCSTEMVEMILMNPEFAKRKVNPVAISFGNKPDSISWIADICKLAGGGSTTLPFPLVCDENREVGTLLGMIRAEDKDKKDLPLTARQVLVCDENKKLKACEIYPSTSGRNFPEILRLLDTLLVTKKTRCYCPANWQPGDKILVPNPPPAGVEKNIKDITEVKLPSGKSYMWYGKLKKN